MRLIACESEDKLIKMIQSEQERKIMIFKNKQSFREQLSNDINNKTKICVIRELEGQKKMCTMLKIFWRIIAENSPNVEPIHSFSWENPKQNKSKEIDAWTHPYQNIEDMKWIKNLQSLQKNDSINRGTMI